MPGTSGVACLCHRAGRYLQMGQCLLSLDVIVQVSGVLLKANKHVIQQQGGTYHSWWLQLHWWHTLQLILLNGMCVFIPPGNNGLSSPDPVARLDRLSIDIISEIIISIVTPHYQFYQALDDDLIFNNTDRLALDSIPYQILPRRALDDSVTTRLTYNSSSFYTPRYYDDSLLFLHSATAFDLSI